MPDFAERHPGKDDAVVSTERQDPQTATSRAQQGLVLVAIVLLAFNLRPAAVSVGPVLDEIRAGTGMSSTSAGLLTSLPVVAFAVFGALAPRIARVVGPHRLTLVALVCVALGLYLRSRAHAVPTFLAFSLLGLIGMATANVVLPSLVKRHFPTRVGLMTGIYSTSLAIGLTSASVFTVPLSSAYGDWRDGLAAWAVTALVAAVPWVALVGMDRRTTEKADQTPVAGYRLGQVARTRVGWVMALFFGLQSLHAYAIFGWMAEVYRSAGFSAHDAGLLLGVITGTSIPLSFIVPALIARMPDHRPVVWVLVACYPIGYVGLIVAPSALALLWAVVIGIATATFPMVLTLIGLRSETPAGTAALSGFTQSVGYTISVVGPFGFGAAHDVTGGWTVPLACLAVLSLPLLWAALAAARPTTLESQLG